MRNVKRGDSLRNEDEANKESNKDSDAGSAGPFEADWVAEDEFFDTDENAENEAGDCNEDTEPAENHERRSAEANKAVDSKIKELAKVI